MEVRAIDKQVSWLVDILNDVYEEFEEWKASRQPDEVATLFWDADKRAGMLMYPDGRTREFSASSFRELASKVELETGLVPLTPIDQIADARRRIVAPVVRGGAPLRVPAGGAPSIPRPVVPSSEAERVYSEIEFLRRKIEAAIRVKTRDFTFDVYYHTKPLSNIDGFKAEFFTTPQAGDSYWFNNNAYAVLLYHLAHVKLLTNTDFMYIYQTVDSGVGNVGAFSALTLSPTMTVKYSSFGDGSVSLDAAFEAFMSCLSNGFFDYVSTTNKSKLRIPTLAWRKKMTTIMVEEGVRNVDTSTSTYKNWLSYVIFYDTEPSLLAYDLLGYAKKTGQMEELVTIPGNSYAIKLEAKPINSTYESIASKYFFDDNGVPGTITVSIPVIVFGK